jgi:O-antigen/teichoic acid export membrane protein
LQWLRGEDVGLYNAGYRLYEGTTYAAGVLSAVLTPRLARLWGTSTRAHARLARLGLVAAVGLSVVIAVPLYVWAPLWLDITFPLYLSAVPVLQWLAVGLPCVFTIWILHAIAIAASKDRLLVTATATGLVINVGLNLFLIPQQGPVGAAVATVVGEACTLAVLLFGLRRVLAGAGAMETT